MNVSQKFTRNQITIREHQFMKMDKLGIFQMQVKIWVELCNNLDCIDPLAFLDEG